MRRVVRQEILDTDQALPEEVRLSLLDLQRINRCFGGISTTAKLIDKVLEQTRAQTLSLLDVGAASGDVPQALDRRLASRGVQLTFTLFDRDPKHFAKDYAGARVTGDALAIPFRDGSFDVVACSLFTHHLEPDQIVAFAKEALRVARMALLINDLRRSLAHLAAVWIGQPLSSRVTRHDSIASVRRSYTAEEMRGLLLRATSGKIEIENSYFFRMGVIAWK